MSVIVSVEDKGASQKQVKVAIPAPAVEAETQRVAQDYRKRVRLPGFRKGKVPQELLKKRFGEEIEREVVERLVPRYWRQAEAEAQFEPMLPPELGEVDHRPGEDLTFVAVVDLAPEIDLRNISDFDLPDPVVAPSKEDIDNALEEIRRGFSDWIETERPAANGDRVKVAIRELTAEATPSDDEAEPAEPAELTESAEPAEPAEPETQPLVFEVGDAQVWEELGLAATGKTKGQSAEFERSAGEDAPTQRYSFLVEEVLERDPPPLDDAFAERVGKFESVEALREDVEKRLAASNEAERRRQREKALLDQLVERHPITLSDRVVHHEVEQVLTEYAGDLSRQGVDVENAEIEWQKLGEQVRPQAERRVKARLILDRVAKEKEMAVDEEDLEAAIAAIARREGQPNQAVRQALDRNDRLAPLREQLLRDKTILSLLGEEPEPSAAADDEDENEAGESESEPAAK